MFVQAFVCFDLDKNDMVGAKDRRRTGGTSTRVDGKMRWDWGRGNGFGGDRMVRLREDGGGEGC